MVYRKESKCLLRKLFIIAALLFVPCFIVLENTKPVDALSKDFNAFLIRYSTSSSNPYQPSNWLGYGTSDTLTNHTPSFYKFDRVASQVTNIAVPSGNNNLVVTEKWNFVVYCLVNPGGDYFGRCPDIQGEEQYLYSVSINGTPKEFISDNVNLYITDWPCPSPTVSGSYLPCRTFTLQASAVVRDVSGTINNINVNVEFPGSVVLPLNTTTSGFFEQSDSNRAIFDFLDASGTITNELLQQQLQNQNLQLQALENLNITINQQNNQENQAIDNIDNQSVSDIPNSESSQTTSIIGVISSFVTALGTVQTGSCQLTLPFPSFIGGDTVVNPCNGKDKAPTIVSVGSSMFLIGVFIPFAFVVLKMIYNEIRSFTNG